jgi:hypothetical protein
MGALHLIAIADTRRSLPEHLAAPGTDNLYSIGHEMKLLPTVTTRHLG